MSLINKLKEKYPEIADWKIEQGDTHEKERINQSTETTEFITKSLDGKQQKRFTLTSFTDHRGNKESWREEIIKEG